jgi:hypothetical protein
MTDVREIDEIFFALNGTRFVTSSKYDDTCSNNSTFGVRQTADGKLLGTFRTTYGGGAALSPDGRYFAHNISMWELRISDINDCTHVDIGGKDIVAGAAVFSLCGQLLATVVGYETIVWNAETYKHRRILANGGGRMLAFSPDARILASVMEYGEVNLFDWATGTFTGCFKCEVYFKRFMFSPVGLRFDTDHGVLDAENSVSRRTGLPGTALPHLFLSQKSIAYGNQNVLQLPPDCWPLSHDVHQSIIALGLDNGRVIFIHLDIAKMEAAGFRQRWEAHNLRKQRSETALKTFLNRLRQRLSGRER